MYQVIVYNPIKAFLKSILRNFTMNFRNMTKLISIAIFINGIILFVGAASLIIVLLVKMNYAEKQVEVLSSEVLSSKSQVESLTKDLQVAHSQLVLAKAQLDVIQVTTEANRLQNALNSTQKQLKSALVPQSNISDAFTENVAKPAVNLSKTIQTSFTENVGKPTVEFSKSVWESAVEGSKKITAYVSK